MKYQRLFANGWVILLLGVLTLGSCKKQPPDGIYCAKVQYNNSETGRLSYLMLIAEIKDNTLIDISFPEGHTDQSQLKPIKIPENGEFTAVSAAGQVYKVQMEGPAEKCLKAKNMLQCKGLSKDGQRCKRYTDNKNGLCWQHKDQKK